MNAAEQIEPKPYFFRPYSNDDLNFIQRSWGKSYFDGCGYDEFLRAQEFDFHHRPLRDRILACPRVAIIVCASRADQDTIVGYIIVEMPRKTNATILHYLYVKKDFWGMGIANELIDSAIKSDIILMTHVTEKAARIMQKKDQKYRNFYLIPHLV